MPSRCIGNLSGINGQMGLVIAWEFEPKTAIEFQKNPRKTSFERVVAQVSQTDAFALYWESKWISWSNGSHDHMGGIQDAEVPTSCHTSESNRRLHVVL
ncbi:uncharacterized protein G2W53_010057 [Senna tora]|uniref:Uncharacterized protein n=1 Tax=Senna tora TaxID=362788 RepID=A0A834X0D2_9FABA|nr:uncharacterized protein G2W53_010057 [Senna tora]